MEMVHLLVPHQKREELNIGKADIQVLSGSLSKRLYKASC